jgi:hypothetical protein
METPTIKANIDRIRSEVSPYSGTKRVNSYNYTLLFSPSRVYLIIPVVILILLIYWSPGFIKYEKVDDKGNVMRKVSYKKLSSYWLILSSILIIGYFGYNYKISKELDSV